MLGGQNATRSSAAGYGNSRCVIFSDKSFDDLSLASLEFFFRTRFCLKFPRVLAFENTFSYFRTFPVAGFSGHSANHFRREVSNPAESYCTFCILLLVARRSHEPATGGFYAAWVNRTHRRTMGVLPFDLTILSDGNRRDAGLVSVLGQYSLPNSIASNIAKSGSAVHNVVTASFDSIVALPFPDFASAPAVAGHKEKYERRSTNVI